MGGSDPVAAPARRPAAFLLAFALGNAGGVLAYLPFLTLLLPLKVEAIAGAARVTVLSAILGGGAVAASLGNILVGLLIDRSVLRGGGLRPWIALGVVATAASYGAIGAAQGPVLLFVAVVLFQLAVNVLIAPVAVIMVDEMPDAQKGLAGGLLTLGQPMAMLAATVLALLYDRGEARAYLAICAGVAVLALPLLLSRPRPAIHGSQAPVVALARRDLTLLALSRLLLMTANCVLGGILVYYFESLSAGLSGPAVAARVGMVSMIAYGAAVPLAVLLGASRTGTGGARKVALGATLAGVCALALLALAPGWGWAGLGYGLFVCALQVYTSQHSAIVAHALRSPRHRARDLGFQNLANTIPALVGPGLVVLLYAVATMPVLIWTAAALVIASALALVQVAPSLTGTNDVV